MIQTLLRARGPLLALLVLPLGACSTVGYYAQAVGGHFSLMRARQPIEEVLGNDSTSPELRQKLQTLSDARVFATTDLLLPDNDSYSTYVETGRKAVTWNVVASPEFSLAAKKWCFPIAGCVSYRGYFDRADADSYAAELVKEHFDVTVGGASAYSTLGWFDDPVLDTMLRGSDMRYVGTLFHELAHQVLYVKGDSNFNEAFASFVEQQGVRLWLSERGELGRIEGYEGSLVRIEQFVGLLKQTRDQLQALYTSGGDEGTMRESKKQVFTGMREQYEKLKASWGGYSGYDGWFKRELNNARLLAVATYRKNVPAFQTMYEESGQDMAAFYTLAKQLADLPYKKRQARINQYLKDA